MAKLLYVVHRYAPYPGGSEYNTQRFAEASFALGHDVTVLTDIHKGNFNGVVVTNDYGVLNQSWDLIIVHGDAGTQNVVHANKQKNPVLHLLIRPNDIPIIHTGMMHADFIGCATSDDIEFVTAHNFKDKIIEINYPIKIIIPDMSNNDIRTKFDIDENKKVWLSAGGFAPHKGMEQLVKLFGYLNMDPSREWMRDNPVQLVLMGYDDHYNLNSLNKDNVSIWKADDPSHVYELMSISDLYIWNSHAGSEGYGLVLLESMLMGCPWIGKNIAGAKDLAKLGFGKTFNNSDELYSMLGEYSKATARRFSDKNNTEAKKYVLEKHNPVTVTKNMLQRVGI